MVDTTKVGERTARRHDALNKEMKDDWAKGRYARAMGTGLNGVLTQPILGLGDVIGAGVDTTLNEAVFPVAQKAGEAWDYGIGGIKDFGRGFLGKGDEPTENANPVSQAGLALSGSADSARGGVGGLNKFRQQQGEQDIRAQRQAALASQNRAVQPRELTFGEKLATFDKENNADMAVVRQQGKFANANTGVGVLPSLPKPELSQAQKPFVASFGSGDAKLSDEKKKLLDAVLTPYKGAKNGQLTANQLGLARQILQGNQQNAADLEKARMQQETAMANAAMNNDTALQREWLQQNAGLSRQAMGDAAANMRAQQQLAQGQQQFDAKLGLDKAQFDVKADLDKQKLDFDRERVNAELEAKRDKNMLDAMNAANGFNKDAFLKVQRNVVGADGLPTTQDDVIDLRTGKSILQQEQPTIQAGTVKNGYRFKGGNPNDKKNWEKV